MLDLITLHDRDIRLGAVVWAAVGKDPEYSPGSLISEICRNARYRADDYEDLTLTAPIDAGAVARRFREILDEADAFVRAMPAGPEGLVFLKDGVPVEPDPADREILDEADAFVRAMPAGPEGLVFLKDGVPVEPDPADLAAYETLGGKRRGHWPSTPDIGGAMIERDPDRR